MKVSAPIDFAPLFVTAALVELRRGHPALEVKLECGDCFVDRVGEGFDVAIRLGGFTDSNYRAVKIGEFVGWLVKGPAVVEACGTPVDPSIVGTMPCIEFSSLPGPTVLARGSAGAREYRRGPSLVMQR